MSPIIIWRLMKPCKSKIREADLSVFFSINRTVFPLLGRQVIRQKPHNNYNVCEKWMKIKGRYGLYQLQPISRQCCGWTGPVLLVMIERLSSEITIRKLWKDRGLLHIWGHTGKFSREREVLLLGGGAEDGGLRVSQSHSLLVTLKHKSWNKMWKRKEQVAQVVSY